MRHSRASAGKARAQSFRVNRFLVRHGQDEQADPPARQLVSKSHDRSQSLPEIAVSFPGAASFGGILDAGSIEEPAVIPQDDFFAPVLEPGKLGELGPGAEAFGYFAGILKVALVGAQVRRSWLLLKEVERLRSLATPEFSHKLRQRDRQYEDQENPNQETLG